jgi:thiamine kinase-like enzyme
MTSAVTRRQIRFADDVAPQVHGELLDLLSFWLGPGEGATVALLTGGASNQNFRVESARGTMVLRLAARDVGRFGVQRDRSLAAHRAAAEAGLAPKLIRADERTGDCLSMLVPGETLAPGRARVPEVLAAIGSALRRLHQLTPAIGRWSVFDDVRRYIATALDEGLRLPSDIDLLLGRLTQVEAVFQRLQVRDALCHNDLQPQNLILSDSVVTVVDWEYSALGNPYFDLGGLSVNIDLTRDGEAFLAEKYFRKASLEHLARIRLMRVASAMREATWAVIAGPVLNLDWDYDEWADSFFARAREQCAEPHFSRCLREALQEAMAELASPGRLESPPS